MAEPPDEIALTGGNVTTVVRVGDTVRRSTGEWTPAVHALLRHLQSVEFPGAPRVLGIDSQGREILTFIEGTPASRPWPKELRTLEGLSALVRLLQGYHAAVATFKPASGAVWRVGAVPLRPGQIIRHGDLGPWNTIWKSGMPRAIIDWDFAEPGEKIEDLAQLAWYSTPLRGDRGWREAGFSTIQDLQPRLKMICHEYGDIDPATVLDAVLRLQEHERLRISDFGAANREPWATFLARGDDQEIEREQAWLRLHRYQLC
jgi:hypothetical protein